MTRLRVAGLVIGLTALPFAAAAQQPAPEAGAPAVTGATGKPPADARGAPAAPAKPPEARPAPPPARAAPERRRPRPYAFCNATARQRGLRGGDRRRFITRCELGYELPPGPDRPVR